MLTLFSGLDLGVAVSLFFALAFVLTAVFVVAPLVFIFWRAFAEGWAVYLKNIADPMTLHAIWLTSVVAVIVVPVNIAFGIAAAPDLLGENANLPQNTAPLALVIAPTRELALQVALQLGEVVLRRFFLGHGYFPATTSFAASAFCASELRTRRKRRLKDATRR